MRRLPAILALALACAGARGQDAAALLPFVTAPFSPLDMTPLAWWQAEGNTLDSARVGPFSGSWAVAAGGFTNGAVGTAFRFDRTDYVSVPNHAALSGFGDFAVAAWVRRAAAPPADENSYIAATWNTIGGQRAWALVRSNSAGAYGATLLLSGDGTANSAMPILPSATVFDGQWRHVVFSRTGTNVLAYIDGAYASKGAYVGTLKASSSATTIGAIGAGGNRFAGDVDDVMIFNRALTAADVEKIYKESKLQSARGPW